MTVRYPTSESDPHGIEVENNNASLTNSAAVRLPQASDPCQADLLNAPAKQLRDRLALVEAGVVWHNGATGAPANTQPVELKLEMAGTLYALTRIGLGANAFYCESNMYLPTRKKTYIEPGSIYLVSGTNTSRGVSLIASGNDVLQIASGIAGGSNCIVQLIGDLAASSNLSAGGNISSGGNVSAEGNVTASAKAKAKNLPAHITGHYGSSGKWIVMADGATISSARSTWADVVSDIRSWCDSNGFTGNGYTLYFSANPEDLTAIGNSAYKPGTPNAESIPVTAKAFIFFVWPPAS